MRKSLHLLHSRFVMKKMLYMFSYCPRYSVKYPREPVPWADLLFIYLFVCLFVYIFIYLLRQPHCAITPRMFMCYEYGVTFRSRQIFLGPLFLNFLVSYRAFTMLNSWRRLILSLGARALMPEHGLH